VGDDAQCLIEGTEVTMADGTRRPIETIRAGDQVLSGCGSGHFRASRVTDVIERRAETTIRITTLGGRVIESTPEHMHFAGYRPGRVPPMFMTYLMRRRNRGCRVGMTRTLDRSGKPIAGLYARAMKEQADEAWVVSTHATEPEARVAEAVLSLRYGIPTVPFIARPGVRGNSIQDSQELIDRIFRSVDSEAGGHRLLEEEGLWRDTPHHTPQTFTLDRRALRDGNVASTTPFPLVVAIPA
jgi:DNA helicase-2/ATP-dependent DNA helicase PcrA